MEFITELIAPAPGLAVAAFIVWRFLGYQEKRDAAMAAMHQEHLEARGETRRVLEENTKVIHKHDKQVEHTLDKLGELCEVLKMR